MVVCSSTAGQSPQASAHDLPRQQRRGIRQVVKSELEHGSVMGQIGSDFNHLRCGFQRPRPMSQPLQRLAQNVTGWILGRRKLSSPLHFGRPVDRLANPANRYHYCDTGARRAPGADLFAPILARAIRYPFSTQFGRANSQLCISARKPFTRLWCGIQRCADTCPG